jgi:hypothetical protein
MFQVIKEAALQHGVMVRILADIDDVISKSAQQNLREKGSRCSRTRLFRSI